MVIPTPTQADTSREEAGQGVEDEQREARPRTLYHAAAALHRAAAQL